MASGTPFLFDFAIHKFPSQPEDQQRANHALPRRGLLPLCDTTGIHGSCRCHNLKRREIAAGTWWNFMLSLRFMLQ
jgi:hypothetical protein